MTYRVRYVVNVTGAVEDCTVTTDTGPTIVDSGGNTCIPPANFVVTSCSGSCSSTTTGGVRFKDDNTAIAASMGDCGCCAGIGNWVDVQVQCGNDTRTIQVSGTCGSSYIGQWLADPTRC